MQTAGCRLPTSVSRYLLFASSTLQKALLYNICHVEIFEWLISQVSAVHELYLVLSCVLKEIWEMANCGLLY